MIVCLFILAGCNGSNGPKYRRIALDNSLLWEISGNGLSSPSYLFGTDHLTGANFLDSLPWVMLRFKQCKAVACEVDIDSGKTESLHHVFLKNDSLSNLFSKNEFDEIDKCMLRYMPFSLLKFNRLKPVYAYNKLSNTVLEHTTSQENRVLDWYFHDEGKRSGYKNLALDPVKFHDSLLYDAPLDIQKKQLLYLVRHIKQMQDSRHRMFKLYHEQNLTGLEKHLNAGEVFTDSRLDFVLRYRDLMWLRELPAIMKQQPTFIAVGAGHLLWDCGLINQLRLKGYTVKPVTNNTASPTSPFRGSGC